jgi:hypothetical protein
MIESNSDKLLGLWHTNNENGIHVLYGSAISFEKDGKGTMNSWGGGDDPDDPVDSKYDYEFAIEWIRIDDETIKIRKAESLDWTTLRLEISTYVGNYGVYYDKIVSLENHQANEYINEWFWDIPEALYRQHTK